MALLGPGFGFLTRWTHRLRIGQPSMVRQDAGNVAGGPEGVYRVQARVNGVVVRTWNDLMGTSQTNTLAERTADNENLALPTQFRITPINGGLDGLARTTDQSFIKVLQ